MGERRDLKQGAFWCLLLVFFWLAGVGCGDGVEPREAAVATENESVVPSETVAPPAPSVVSSEPATSVERAETALPNPDWEGAALSALSLSETSNARYLADVAQDVVHLDPRREGWVTEVVSEAVTKQLKELKKKLTATAGIDAASLTPLLSPQFRSSVLRPQNLREEFSDGQRRVLRAADLNVGKVDWRSGPGGLALSLQELFDSQTSGNGTAEDSGLRDVEAFFKVVSVDLSGRESSTKVLCELLFTRGEHRVQQNAVWNLVWHAAPERGVPLLGELRVSEFEEVVINSIPGLWFSDETHALLGANESFREQLQYGVDHWRERLDWRFTQEVTSPHGLAVGDVNGDLLDDLFVCETGGLPNRLYVQQPDGTLRDVSATAGVDYLEPAASALIVDFENDGDQDMVVASGRNLVFLENLGAATFRQQLIHSGDSIARSLTAVDYDLDGRLDLYVCGYFSQAGDGSGIGRPMPYHDANNGVRNYLLRNAGDWTFRDVTDEVGLGQNNQRFSYAAAWEDFDNDGDLDLYVANDFGRNNLFRNDAGKFQDVAAAAGVEDLSAGMSVSWGDFNNDGWMDLYVGNMFSSAGNRVAYQRQYRARQNEQDRGHYQRHARGNTLFLNEGDGTFRDVSETAGVTMGRWAWGSIFADLNNDGWDDLVVGNGFVTSPDDTGDL